MNKLNIKIKFISVFVIAGISGLMSCEDYLDKAPQSDIDTEEAFKNFRNFQGFTEQLYNHIPIQSENWWHNDWNLGEEEYWQPNETRCLSYSIDRGNFWDWMTKEYGWFKMAPQPWEDVEGDYTISTQKSDKGRLWGLSWAAIRTANIGIANLDKLIEATGEEKNLIAGQLYFFRGWFHFMLIQYWGGMPYINRVLPSDEVLRLERLSYQAISDSIANDFQKAANLLPVNWDDTNPGKATLGNNNLRINKIMALAYLGKNLLWAGSPLMNFESTGNRSYNTEYCIRAAQVFAEVLKISESTGRYELADFEDYSEIFYTYNKGGKLPGLKEAIFMEGLAESGNRWRWNQINDYRPKTLINSGLKINPTSNYVHYYGMANGLPIPDGVNADPESGYDPEYPWRNRDPRFYHDIIFDGMKCALNSDGSLTEERQYASLYTGGLYRTSDGVQGVLTGYMNQKFSSQFLNEFDGYQDNNVCIMSFLRLADVYLMYAEAAAVGYSSPDGSVPDYDLTALDAVNKIRERAGAGLVNSKFLGSTESFLSELRRERAVELAFEGHRFVDLRRWLLLTEQPYTFKKAAEFDRDPTVSSAELYANPAEAHVLNYRETMLIERKLESKHYWFPLPVSDVNIYREFEQNPGW